MKSNTFNGIRCYAPTSVEKLISFAYEKKCILVAVNAEKILLANDSTRRIINNNVGYPDGVGAVLAFKRNGIRSVFKIPGCELWLSIIEQYYNSKTFYLVGGTEATINKTVRKLKRQFLNIDIVGHCNGYFSKNVEADLIEDIKSTKPDIIFVAMGSPKQELLMEKLSKNHDALYQGLGGSFDVFVGNVKRAPRLWITLHLESLYRCFKEPKRVKRQLNVLKFLLFLLMGKFKQ
jgi:UDP-N-acetyl-D-mannosaminouronate:lipid I N-acetyl-D-mannosaminouronosyltransferase